MARYILPVISCMILMVMNAHSQSLGRPTISNGGGQGVAGGWVLSWTTGEPVSGSFNPGGGSIMTAGFEQPLPPGTYPVEWLDFRVSWQGDAALLEWTTGEEINNHYFVIERSVDGSLFMQTDTIMATSNPGLRNSYQTLDPEVGSLHMPVIYYRLRQTDLDGAYSFSNILLLNIHPDAAFTAFIYPNPTSDVVYFRDRQPDGQPLSLQILNTRGQIVRKLSISREDARQDVPVSLSGLASGLYYLKAMKGEDQISFRLILR